MNERKESENFQAQAQQMSPDTVTSRDIGPMPRIDEYGDEDKEDALACILFGRHVSPQNIGEIQIAALWRIRDLQRELASVQAHLDVVMLEYCPEDMTEEQTSNWWANQWAMSADE